MFNKIKLFFRNRRNKKENSKSLQTLITISKINLDAGADLRFIDDMQTRYIAMKYDFIITNAALLNKDNTGRELLLKYSTVAEESTKDIVTDIWVKLSSIYKKRLLIYFDSDKAVMEYIAESVYHAIYKILLKENADKITKNSFDKETLANFKKWNRGDFSSNNTIKKPSTTAIRTTKK